VPPVSLAFVRPCIPTVTSQPPVGERWVHEAKWDGWRFQIIKAAGQVRLFARIGTEWTERLPAIADAFATLPARSAQLDGELCFCDEQGRPNFHALQGTMRWRYPDQAALSFHAFDLLHLNGADLRPKPLLEGRKRLAGLHDAAEADQFYLPDAFDDGLACCIPKRLRRSAGATTSASTSTTFGLASGVFAPTHHRPLHCRWEGVLRPGSQRRLALTRDSLSAEEQLDFIRRLSPIAGARCGPPLFRGARASNQPVRGADTA
jgi:hypothetical protein